MSPAFTLQPAAALVPRLDTRLEAEAAEFLVLGQMLLRRIPTYKTYTNMPGYDLVATAPEHNSAARIQVKSRWRTHAPGFPLQRLDCDFVVFVRLNRGSRDGRARVMDPEYFVFPTGLLREVPRSEGWNKLMLKHVPEWESYRDRWDLVQSFLQRPAGPG